MRRFLWDDHSLKTVTGLKSSKNQTVPSKSSKSKYLPWKLEQRNDLKVAISIYPLSNRPPKTMSVKPLLLKGSGNSGRMPQAIPSSCLSRLGHASIFYQGTTYCSRHRPFVQKPKGKLEVRGQCEVVGFGGRERGGGHRAAQFKES